MISAFNNRVRQILLLVIMVCLVLLLFRELYLFFPGFLGAITLYILARNQYNWLVTEKKLNRSLAAAIFMIGFVICIAIPIYFTAELLSSRITALVNNQDAVMQSLRSVSDQIRRWTGQELLSESNIAQLPKQISGYIPSVLNSTVLILGNLAMLLFLSYFMFTNGETMERSLHHFIPLRNQNIHILAGETKNMVRANAIGIPLISVIQGITALIGYWIFGVKDYVLWGFITGVFAFFPVAGTMLIWIPIVIYVFSTGHTTQGIGLLIYSLVVTGNIDYLARITLLKKIGNVHPVTTVLGVIAGLQLFGFWGFIFGPLLISYLILLFRIYTSEFGPLHSPDDRFPKNQ